MFDVASDAVTEFSFGIDFGDDPIAIGTTGLFLTAAGVSVQNPDSPSNFLISGSVAVQYGDDPITLAGESAEIVAAKGTVTVSANEFVLSGIVYFGADQPSAGDIDSDGLPDYHGLIGTGSGKVTLDWGAKKYSISCDVKLYDDTFEFSGDFEFDGSFNSYFVYIEADAKVKVPGSIPFIGGQTLGSMHFVFDYQKSEGGTP
ncbi:MAG: hypothetical protein K2X87_30535 [Gemmataceae bacterium]|nr:hypothetical protein [Gemmataceae bacterium]